MIAEVEEFKLGVDSKVPPPLFWRGGRVVRPKIYIIALDSGI
jgi:hypothetical protein